MSNHQKNNSKKKKQIEKSKLPKPIAEFIAFISGAKTAIAFAIAVVSANAVSDFINSIIKGIITPAIALILPKGRYENLVFEVNGSKFLIGNVLSATINMIIITFLIFIIAKYIVKDDKLLEKTESKFSK
jgi:large conductance mechanosensitive channel